MAWSYDICGNGVLICTPAAENAAPRNPSTTSNTRSGCGKLISRSIWVNSGWRSARKSSSRKQRTIWKYLSKPEIIRICLKSCGARLTDPGRKPGVDPSEEPPAVFGRGLASSVAGASLLGRQDLEHPRTAHRAHALQGRPAVGHLHLLGVGDLPLGLAFHTVALIRSHRGLSTLRHCVPPLGGGVRGAGCVGGGQGRLPRITPPGR